MELSDYRNKIDDIDDRIAMLLEERYKLVGEIAKYKARSGIGIYDSGRENEIVNRINGRIENREYAGYILDSFCSIMDISRQFQSSYLANIVLIGMPGCGKSSVGRAFAEEAGYDFVDADSEFTAKYGCTPADYILQHGEAEFRKQESSVLEGFRPNCRTVYALGGGVVIVPDNFELVRPLGTVVYIKRDIKNLDTTERPLSLQKGPEQLERERSTLYELWSDAVVDNNAAIGKTVSRLKEIFCDSMTVTE